MCFSCHIWFFFHKSSPHHPAGTSKCVELSKTQTIQQNVRKKKMIWVRRRRTVYMRRTDYITSLFMALASKKGQKESLGSLLQNGRNQRNLLIVSFPRSLHSFIHSLPLQCTSLIFKYFGRIPNERNAGAIHTLHDEEWTVHVNMYMFVLSWASSEMCSQWGNLRKHCMLASVRTTRPHISHTHRQRPTSTQHRIHRQEETPSPR